MEENIIIDFTNIQEGAELGRLGAKIKRMLFYMFDTPISSASPVSVRGTPLQVQAFVGAMAGEKKFIQAVRKHGLDSPQTGLSRISLNSKITEFERETGIVWPFK